MNELHDRREPEVVELQAVLRGPAPDAKRSECLSEHEWFLVGWGITGAGGLYPIVLGIVMVAISCVKTVMGVLQANVALPGPGELLGEGLAACLAALFLGVIGTVWAFVVTTLTVPIVYFFVRSLRLKGSLVYFGAIWGGLVGFLAILPVSLMAADVAISSANSAWSALLLFAAGPGITTPLGQLGGVWGARRELKFERRFRGASKPGPPMVGAAARLDMESAHDQAEPRLQFGVRHMLWIMFWFSLLLSVIRLSGIRFELALPLLIFWLAYQSLTLYFGVKIAAYLDSARARRTQIAPGLMA